MIDDNKRTERIPANFTELEFLHICREATRLDKKPAEFVHFLVRRSLFGSVGMPAQRGNESNSDSEGGSNV